MSAPSSPSFSSLSSGNTSPSSSICTSISRTTSSTSSLSSHSYNITTTSSSQTMCSATEISRAAKRKRKEASELAPKKRLRKEKNIEQASSSTRSSFDDEEQKQADQFDPDACLCALFNIAALPPELSCGGPTVKHSQYVPQNDSEKPSCSYTPPHTKISKSIRTSQLKYFNLHLLSAFQKELYREQQKPQFEPLKLIKNLGSSYTENVEDLVLYTTTRKEVSCRLDWRKLHAALELLSVKEPHGPNRVGQERAERTTRLLKTMCRRTCKFKKDGYFIGDMQLTKWCGAALTSQKLQLLPTFVAPVKSCKRKFFIPAPEEKARILNNPQAFLATRLAVTLFNNRHSTRRVSRIPSPPSSPRSESNE